VSAKISRCASEPFSVRKAAASLFAEKRGKGRPHFSIMEHSGKIVVIGLKCNTSEPLTLCRIELRITSSRRVPPLSPKTTMSKGNDRAILRETAIFISSFRAKTTPAVTPSPRYRPLYFYKCNCGGPWPD